MTKQNLDTNESELLTNFTEKMQKELVENAAKGNFADWNPSLYELQAEIAHHMAKLSKALIEVDEENKSQSRRRVNEYSSDVANFLAKAASIYGIDSTQSATVEITKRTELVSECKLAHYYFTVVDAIVSRTRITKSLLAYNNALDNISFNERTGIGFFDAPSSTFEHEVTLTIPLLPV